MRALLRTIVCKFGGDPATSVVEVAICAKFTDRRTDRQTDRQTDDGRLTIALAHWNELIAIYSVCLLLFCPFSALVLLVG